MLLGAIAAAGLLRADLRGARRRSARVPPAIWVLIAFLLAATAFSLFQVPYIALPAELVVGLRRPHPAALGARDGADVRDPAVRRGRPDAAQARRRGREPRLPDHGRRRRASCSAPACSSPRSSRPPGPDLRGAAHLGARRTTARGSAALRRSQPFRALLATFLLQALATGMMLAGAAYVATWVLGDPDAVTFLFVALIAPALVFAPVWAIIARRIGKERAFGAASVLFGVAALSLVLLVVDPGAVAVRAGRARRRRLRGHAVAADGDAARTSSRTTRARTGRATPAPSAASGPRGRPPAWRSAPTVLRPRALAHRLPRVDRAPRSSTQSPTRHHRHRLSFSVVPAALIAAQPLGARAVPAAARRHRGRCDALEAAAETRRVARLVWSDDRFRREPRGHPGAARRTPLPPTPRPTAAACCSYVYDSGLAELDELAADAIRAVQPVNGLDPTTFTLGRGARARGRRLRARAAARRRRRRRHVTTGGTESCLLAVKTARDVWREQYPDAAVAPRLVAPGHRARGVPEGGALLRTRARPRAGRPPTARCTAERDRRPARRRRRARRGLARRRTRTPRSTRSRRSRRRCAARGIAAARRRLHRRLVLPFWRGPTGDCRLGLPRCPASRASAPTCTSSATRPKGASVLLQRGRDRQRAQYFATTRWPGYPVVNPTMLGSKSAGPLAASWAIIQALGRRRVRRARRVVRALDSGADRARSTASRACASSATRSGRCSRSRPTTPSAPERRVDPHHWADAARGAGWVLQLQPGLVQADGMLLPPTTHLTITPVTEAVLLELVPALVGGRGRGARGAARRRRRAARGAPAARGARRARLGHRVGAAAGLRHRRRTAGCPAAAGAAARAHRGAAGAARRAAADRADRAPGGAHPVVAPAATLGAPRGTGAMTS